ncbi:MAG: DUF3124 domain-containing protein [Brasilonema octagenarum HA4186-MV1]|jgi:hypothetical protein|nr:DUF3124 domain-containing protein [Brasilonema octagenarum HA4186-MV1]
MKLYPVFYLAIALILLTSCTSPQNPSQSEPDMSQANQSQKVVTLDKNFKAVMGETIYVPIYSHIYHGDKKRIFDLAATLSIRNTDLSNSIIITSVRYYDSNGKQLRQYLERPIQLDALASTDFVVDRTDTSGGVGANFLVEWVAQTKVFQPVVEAVMIGTDFQQGISWISPGKVIKSQSNSKQSPSVQGS